MIINDGLKSLFPQRPLCVQVELGAAGLVELRLLIFKVIFGAESDFNQPLSDNLPVSGSLFKKIRQNRNVRI